MWAIGLALNLSAGILNELGNPKRLEDYSYTDKELYQLLFDGLATTDFFGATVS